MKSVAVCWVLFFNTFVNKCICGMPVTYPPPDQVFFVLSVYVAWGTRRMCTMSSIVKDLCIVSGCCEPVWPSGKALGW